MEGLIYSPKQKIPLCKLVYDSKGERLVEFLNKKTARTELIKASVLTTYLIYLLEMEMANGHKEDMIYSPKWKIPIGMLTYDEVSKVYYIEVKYKHKMERIRFTTYVSLML